MIKAMRKDSESTGAFLRRFVKKIQASGVLMRARKAKVKVKAKTKRAKQLIAVRRAKVMGERERLYKLGKLDEYGR